MKKIFTLLTAIILCSGMVVQAQGKILPKKPGQPIVQKSLTNKTKTPSVSNRRNAPQGPWTYTYSWSWSDFRTSSDEYKKLCSSGSLDAYMYDWIDNSGFDIWIYLAFDRTKAGTYTYNNVNYVMPAKGTYTIQQNMEEWAMADWNAQWDGVNWNESMFYDPGASNYNDAGGFYLTSGSANVAEGATGPYITISNVALSYYDDWNEKYYDFGGGNSFTIGSPAVYRTVSVLSNSNTMGTVSYEVKSGYVYTYNITDWKNGSVYTLTAEPKSGYRFVCWKKGSTQISTNATTDVTIDGDATYTAYFESAGPTFTLTLDVTSNGTVTVRDADLDNALVTFTNGEAKVGERHNISITATPATGYHLTSVTLGEELINNLNQTFEISEDITLSVVFEPDVYTITYKDKGNGEFTGTHGANHPTTHTYGTATALVNPTRESYTFGGWYTNSACTGAAITSIGATAYTSAPTLYAKWRGAITTSVSPSNYGTVTAGGTYDLNTNITLTATSANDRYYKFDHWLKDGNNYSGGATITPAVTANATYTAVFRNAAAGTITGLSNNNSYGTVTVSPSSEQNGGTAVTLTPVANEGYTFTQWSDGNTDNPRTVYVDGDADYTAQFMFGVSLNLLAGCKTTSPLEYRVLLPDYEVYFKAGNNWSYGDGEEIPLSYINTSASYIKDHGTTVTIGNDVYAYTHTEGDRKILQLNFTGSNGKYYQILLRGANYNDCTQNFDQTFTNLTAQSSGTGWRILYADNGVTKAAANASFGPNHWDISLPVYIDESKCGSENDGVPTGVYPILDTDEEGTIQATPSSGTVRASGYWTCQGINQTHKLVTGYMDLVNRDGNTYAQIDGYTSSCKPLHCVAKSSSSVGTPLTINCTAGEGGSVNLVWHSSNCGNVTYAAAEMPQKFFNGNTVTFNAVANEGYEFWRWSDEEESVETSTYGASRNVTVSGNLTLQAIFRQATAKHTVTFYDYDGTTELQTGDVEEGTQPTYSGVIPTRVDDDENYLAYEFAGWRSSADGQVYTAELPEVAEDDVTYTAVYDEYFRILDNKENGDAYYDTLASKAGKTLNVKYERTFEANQWYVFSLPFGYSYRGQNNPNYTFRDRLYTLVSMNYTKDGYLTLNCMPATGGFKANKPHILIIPAGEGNEISNPTFKNVTITALDEGDYSVQNLETTVGGTIEFRNTTERVTLEKSRNVIYISNKKLYYANLTDDSWMRPFRGYFYLNAPVYYTPSRIRLVNDKGEQIETLPEAADETSVETRKYIENGILIIERAGIKYDAQGHKIQ